jgi:hypothetical protein
MRSNSSFFRQWLLGAVLGLTCLLSGSGCQQEPVTVSGKVTSGGKPVTSGYVVFHGAYGHVSSGPIGKDGTYSVAGVMPGEVRVSLGGAGDTMPGSAEATPRSPALPVGKDRPRVPPKYFKPATSDLKYTIASGNQQIDLQAD